MPLRLRLTLWYGTTLALVLVSFAFVLYTVMAQALRAQVDESLEMAALAMVRSLERHPLGSLLNFERLSSEFSDLVTIDKFFQIFSPTGKVTIQSPHIQARGISLNSIALEAAFAGKTVFQSVKGSSANASLRLVSVPFTYHKGRNKAPLYIVQVGTSLDPMEATLHRLFIVLLITGPIALALAMAGGWFLAGRALRPVESIRRTAQNIASGDLTQRLTVKVTPDEIGRLVETFNAMIASLDASFREVRQFTADASHELRTPLTVLKGETELALRRPRTAEDYRQVLESSLEEIDRMSKIVDELLFLARADLGEVQMESVPVRLGELVKDIQRQADPLGREQGVRTTVSRVDPAVVRGDELRLREMLTNLVDNAIKYSRPGGEVEVTLVMNAGTAHLSVSDQGIGMDHADQTRIFDRFYRADAARAHSKKGTGLGLAICKWIAECHKGRIEVQSKVGEGSRFTVVLPLDPLAH